MEALKPQSFNINGFQRLLRTKCIGRSFLYRTETDSTMKLAEREANEGAPSGTLILAETQTHGKGRVQGRTWSSQSGNLYITIILRGLPKPEGMYKLNLASAVSVATTFQEHGVNAKVKWPNDVWIGGKKACGMMIDDISTESECVFSLGIGINVNQDYTKHEDEDLRKSATSLAQSLELSTVPREPILATYCNYLETLLYMPMEKVLDIYTSFDILIGGQVVVMPKKKEDPERYNAKAIRFDSTGHLIIQTENGERALSAEEVSIRPENITSLEKDIKLPSVDAASIITGKWRNELGSNVTFSALPDGVLQGEYTTAVGNAKVTHKLHGSWTPLNNGSALMGWSVCWIKLNEPWDPKSVASWSAKLFNDGDKPKIISSWYLTTNVPNADNWKNTNANKDQFEKLP